MGQRKTIWFAIVMSTFVYAIVVYSLSRSWPRPGPFGTAVQQQIVLGLYAAVVAVFFAALILPSRIEHHRQRFIVRISLFESCAILGLLVAFLTHDWRLFIAPFVLSLMGLMTSYPSDVE
ncbi:MAG TPA: hypothetical protein VKB93_05305 [Thermoanaerobaculia bacterium]|nr:hypothetical protein [Thermoanaerobaculia bacterium]